MTCEHHERSPVIAFGVCISIMLAAFPAAAQNSPLPVPAAEPAAAEVSPELAEIERKTQDLRSRLQEWTVKAAEYLAAGRDAEARADVIDATTHSKQRREKQCARKTEKVPHHNLPV